VKFSIAASLLVQTYVVLLGILLMPVYLQHLGPEAFGLIGVFLMAQAWMQVLDMGFTPALSRDVARMRAGELPRGESMVRLVTLEWVFGIAGFGVVALVWVNGELIAQHWLQGSELDFRTIALSVSLMAAAIAVRWYAGLYRAVLTGLERQKRINALLAGFATLRFAGVIPMLVYLSPTPEVFFSYQVLVSVLELLVSRVLGRYHIAANEGARPRLSSLRSMLPLVGSMGFLSLMWIAITQIDKLILSGLLSLRDYGYFTLAVVAAGGVLMLIPSMTQVIQPRLSYLVARGDHLLFKQLYCLASQGAAIGFVVIGASLAFFAETIIQVWTGDAETARASAPILFWYGLGNAIVGIMLVPFMMQFAKGDLRLHVVGQIILLFTLVPALIVAARNHGAIGAGQVFFFANALFLLVWAPLVHKRFLPELGWHWLLRDTLPSVALITSALWLSAHYMPTDMGPLRSLAWIGGASVLAAVAGAFVGSHTRRFLMLQLRTLK
jgi:O-antigen/teichoic acid export membrane protein